MKRIISVLCVVLSSSCIDVEGAYARCFDGGRCGDDAGLPDSGTVDSGTPDAGPAPYDGGTACTSSPFPKLKCAAPISIPPATSRINMASIAAVPEGFIAGWTGDDFVLRRVTMTGGISIVSDVPGVTDGRMSLMSNGRQWVAAWLSYDGWSATCINSEQPSVTAEVITQDGGWRLRNIAPAIDSDGAVGIAVHDRNNNVQLGIADFGCPTELRKLPSSTTTNGVGATWVNQRAGAGFRFVSTGSLAGLDGKVRFLIDARDGGTPETEYEHLDGAPGRSLTTSSTDGGTVFVAYGLQKSTTDELWLFATSASFDGTGAPMRVTTFDPGSWGLSSCGAGCMVTAALREDVGAPLQVSFFRDVIGSPLRGTWDALCDQPATTASKATVSVAYSNGRLGVLHTTPSAVNLYLCEMPPMP